MKVFVLTDSPSPYQVELFNEIEAQGNCELKVGYLRSRDPQRQWTTPDIRHESLDLELNGMRHARDAACESDLVVFNYYSHPHATELIGVRAARGGPWCFWGERPGFRQPAWAAWVDACCEDGSWPSCTIRPCRSGQSESLPLISIDGSLDHGGLISTCRTFLTSNGFAVRSLNADRSACFCSADR